MKYKYTKILVFLIFSLITSCGPANQESEKGNSSDNGNDIENEKNIQSKPDGNYDTLSKIEKIAKDRRNHREHTESDLSDAHNDTAVEMNLQQGKEPHNHGSGNEEENTMNDAEMNDK